MASILCLRVSTGIRHNIALFCQDQMCSTRCARCVLYGVRKIILSYRHRALEKPVGKERLDRFVGSFCAPCGAKTRLRGVSGMNSSPALLREVARHCHPLLRECPMQAARRHHLVSPVLGRPLGIALASVGATPLLLVLFRMPYNPAPVVGLPP